MESSNLLHFVKKLLIKKDKIKEVEFVPWYHDDSYSITKNIEKYLSELPANSFIAIERPLTELKNVLSDIPIDLLKQEFQTFYDTSICAKYNLNKYSEKDKYFEQRAMYRIAYACKKNNLNLLPLEDSVIFFELQNKLEGLDINNQREERFLIVENYAPARNTAMASYIYKYFKDYDQISKLFVITGFAHTKAIISKLYLSNQKDIFMNCIINYDLIEPKYDRQIIKKCVDLNYKITQTDNKKRKLELDSKINRLLFWLPKKPM